MNTQPNISTKTVVIREDGKILALHRSKTHPRHPFFWDLPGGDVEYGEDLTESALREVKEEAGFTVPAITLFDAVGFVDGEGTYWTTLAYVARVSQGTAVVISWEHDQFDWLTKEEFLARQINDRIKRFLSKIS